MCIPHQRIALIHVSVWLQPVDLMISTGRTYRASENELISDTVSDINCNVTHPFGFCSLIYCNDQASSEKSYATLQFEQRTFENTVCFVETCFLLEYQKQTVWRLSLRVSDSIVTLTQSPCVFHVDVCQHAVPTRRPPACTVSDSQVPGEF